MSARHHDLIDAATRALSERGRYLDGEPNTRRVVVLLDQHAGGWSAKIRTYRAKTGLWTATST